MAEIAGVVVSIVACVAQCFSPSGGHRINRWREFKRNFKILKKKVKTLNAERRCIQRRVNLAKKNGDEIEENVQSWLERAEEIEVEIQKWLEIASKIIGDDQEAGNNRKDEETAAAREIGGDAEIAAQQHGEIREDIQATAPVAREIEEGEETVATAAAGEIRADEEKTAAKKGCFNGLCPNLKSPSQHREKAGEIRKDEETPAAGEIGGDAEIAAQEQGEIREDIQAAAPAAREIGEGEETVATTAAGDIRADEEKTAAKKGCFNGLCPTLKLPSQHRKKAVEIRKDEETAAAGEIGGDAEIAAQQQGKIREDIHAAATSARQIGEGEETVAEAGGGEIRADEEKTAAKKGCFNWLCPTLKSPSQHRKKAVEIRKDEETAAPGEIGGDAEIAAQQQGEIREDIQAAAPSARQIGEGEETVAAAGGGEIRADEEKTAAKKGCFNCLCPNLKSRYQLIDEAGEIRKDEETAAAGEIGVDAEIAAQQREEIREDIQAAAPAAGEIGEGEKTVAAAREIRADEEKTASKKGCFKGKCSNLKSRYQFSKEAETLLEDVVKHLEAGKFDEISYPVIPKDPRLSSKDYVTFESQTSTLKNVISSLSDPSVNIVGIYGMGGIGKTTLAKEVASQPEASKLFDLVIFVEVTEKPDITKIQKEIAEKFPGLTFSQDETESSRAAKLNQRLENEKNILIILDNIWAEINLQEIGISLGKGRKLLLTARSVDVLLAKMESQRNFSVELLDDEEAWQLFKKMSRDNIEGSEFESVAREVTEKCAHLPIVIVTVARALRGRRLFEWRNASQQMGLSSAADIQHIHASIELSFNYLKTENLKKTILLIGYANITSIDELLVYGMGVGLFEDINKMEGRRDRVLTLVQQLKDTCLLLDSDTGGEDFSMHDVVREVAMSIASRDPQVFTKLQSLDKDALKVCHSIVLKDVTTGELSQVLEYQQLKLLSISGLRSYSFLYSLKLHDEFFIRMTELKVLVLDRVYSLSLPSSLRLLTNLRALGLYYCHLGKIAIIGDLKKLEILSLKNSKIELLPEEVGHLTRLKSLDLRGCVRLRVIAPYVLSRLSHLEELYMGDFSQWEEEGPDKDRENVSLDELKHLSSLTCLQIQIEDAKTLPRDLFFNKLERYEIEIGARMFYEDSIFESCRKFNLSLINTNICLNDGHIMQLKKIEVLCLDGSQDMKNVLYGLDTDGFQQLKYLQVTDNDNLLCIAEVMMYAANNVFPVLEALIIHNLINLEKICHGQFTTESSFSQLKKIEVEGCDKLENIFSLSITRRLQLLQSIDVSNCENMKEIFAIEREDESNYNISEVIDNIKLGQLRSLTLHSLPQLRSLDYNGNCSNTLFNGKVALPSLEALELDDINVERIWQNPAAAMSCGIQNLTKLILCNCKNLKYLFSSSMIGSFDRLQYVYISKCPALEEIMVIDDEDGLRKEERKNNVALEMYILDCNKLKTLFSWNTYRKFLRLKSLSVYCCVLLEVLFDLEGPDFKDKHNAVVITQLRELVIEYLPKLKQVWNKDPKRFVSFEKLEEVRIYGCDVLKNVFPASIASSLSQLQSLYISACGVEEIVFVAEEEAETNSRFVFPRLASLDLSLLPNCTTFFSRRYTTEWSVSFFVEKVALPSLEVLELTDINVERIYQNPVAAMPFGIQNLTMLVLHHCNNLKYLFSSSMIGSFDRLQYLYISTCPALEEIMVIDDEDGLRKEERKNNVALEMNVQECNKLKTLFPWNTYRKFLRLKSLSVSSCDLLEVIFDLEGPDFKNKYNAAVITQLKKLYISVLPKLKHVWTKDPKRFVSFEKLKKVSIYGCDALKNVFPASIASSFSQLEHLRISKCGVEEIVFVVEEEAKTNSRFVFPRLTSLELWWLPKLTTFFSRRYTTEWVTSFLDEKIFPNLETLNVNGKSISIIWEFPGDFLCKMRNLEIEFDESIVFSSLDFFVQRFHSIKRLEINGKEGYSLFSEPGEDETLAKINNLNKCFDLKHILKEESNMDHLIHLEVKNCYNLVNVLVPYLISFRNLTTLRVLDCRALTNIGTPSISKCMGQLRRMTISGCHMVTELLIADEGDGTKDNEIVFRNLMELHLEGLRSLISFCSANYTLKFPSLEELLVIECPQMKSFTRGNLSTPKLQKVKHGRDLPRLECWNGDLNTTIQQLHEERQMMCSDNDEVDTDDEDDEEDVVGTSNVQMMCSDNDEVDTENEDDEEDVVGTSNVVRKSGALMKIQANLQCSNIWNKANFIAIESKESYGCV